MTKEKIDPKEAFERRVKLARTFYVSKYRTTEHVAIIYAANRIKELEEENQKLKQK